MKLLGGTQAQAVVWFPAFIYHYVFLLPSVVLLWDSSVVTQTAPSPKERTRLSPVWPFLFSTFFPQVKKVSETQETFNHCRFGVGRRFFYTIPPLFVCMQEENVGWVCSGALWRRSAILVMCLRWRMSMYRMNGWEFGILFLDERCHACQLVLSVHVRE